MSSKNDYCFLATCMNLFRHLQSYFQKNIFKIEICYFRKNRSKVGRLLFSFTQLSKGYIWGIAYMGNLQKNHYTVLY